MLRPKSGIMGSERHQDGEISRSRRGSSSPSPAPPMVWLFHLGAESRDPKSLTGTSCKHLPAFSGRKTSEEERISFLR